MSVGWNWQGDRKYKGNCWPHGPSSGKGACSKGITLSLASPCQTPLTKIQFSLCASPGDSQSISSWVVAAILHCPGPQLQAPLSPWVEIHSESGGCTCLLGTRSGPVLQVLLANTSGDHSKARGRAVGGSRGNKLYNKE